MQKKELFAKVRSGKVRVLFGSTAKCGAGTNIQDRLVALHDLDAPWRPGDVGRALRTVIPKLAESACTGSLYWEHENQAVAGGIFLAATAD